MFPATDVCIDYSWTMEYSGYLMTDDFATTLSVLTKNMQTISSSSEPGETAPKLRHIVVLVEGLENNYHPEQVLSYVVCSN